MLVSMGVKHYMGYFKRYNILTLTLRAAFPFIGCTGIIYLGYCFCGWIVLGPYHEKQQEWSLLSALPAFMSKCKDLPTSGRYQVKGSCTCSSITSCFPKCNDSRERLSSESID
ncbi:unnamed protein product [Coregonus sp. 'balchen']|nr:unnamed protein product [Coregonus sp. 'balchen']